MTEKSIKENKCPMCGGTGGWPHPLRPGNFEKCKSCNGSGRVTRTLNEESDRTQVF